MSPVDPSTLRVGSVIGASRMSPYLTACDGDAAKAVRLYSWNIEASAAVLGAYAALEVGVRNAMHSQLTSFYGRPDWWKVAPLSALQREEVRGASQYLDARKPAVWTDGHLVAELKNSFWEGLLVNRLHAALWNPALVRAFPNFDGRRGDLRDRLERLRLLKNRAAHHEPIHERDLRVDHRFMCEVGDFVCHDLGTWIASHSRLPAVVAAQLDQEDRDERLPGHGASLLLLPPTGIAGVIDEIALSILREALEDGFEQLDLLENEVETFALVADPEAVKAVRELVECLWNVYGAIATFLTFDDTADEVERARSARDAFANRVRRSLGVNGTVVTDPRPRRDDEKPTVG